MSKVKVEERIIIDLTATEEICDELTRFLMDKFPDNNIEVGVLSETEFEITTTCYGEGNYYPGCRTLPNGDPGYPDEWEAEFDLYEEDIESSVEEFVGEHDYDIEWFVYSEKEFNL